jgi:nicotinamidase-related amidase
MRRPKILVPLCAVFIFTLLAFAASAPGPVEPNAADVNLQLRTQIHPFHESTQWVAANADVTIQPSKTAIIITDMWDKHWCGGATKRVGQIALEMETVLEGARKAGVLIIHAPSDTMDFYANAPGRLLALDAPKSTLPQPLTIEDAPLPIDAHDGGCDTPGDKSHRVWTRENPILKIAPGDVISDKGTEIYNVLVEHDIDTILYMGVHANMCVLNRSFGVRQMSRWGMHCIIVRDLMDAMYDSASRPYVSHAAGTELVFKFIEQHWAPSTTSKELVAALNASKRPPRIN